MKGVVIRSTGSFYSVFADDKQKYECRLKGQFRLKGLKSTNPIAVGDNVEFEIEKGKNIGVINKIAERKNYIIRKSVNLSKRTHILAANVDQAVLVVTVANPRTSTGFIDRFLATAEAYHIPGILIFNKKDIYDEKEKDYSKYLMDVYSSIGYSCMLVSAFDQSDKEEIAEILKDKVSIISGHSGVGKSTLINSIAPELNLKVGDISTVHSKGKHTTTFAEMHELPIGGFIIDTPGIKEFGLVDIKKEELSRLFPEMLTLSADCKFNNCMHINEPGCAVKDAVEEDRIAMFRFDNYINILNDEQVEDYE